MPMHPATELSDTDCTCLYLAYFITQLCGRHLVLRPQLAAPTQCTSYDMRTPTEIVGSFTYFDTQTTFQLLRTMNTQKIISHDPIFVWWFWSSSRCLCSFCTESEFIDENLLTMPRIFTGFLVNFGFHLNQQYALPSAIFWTGCRNRCRRLSPLVSAFIFIAHR